MKPKYTWSDHSRSDAFISIVSSDGQFIADVNRLADNAEQNARLIAAAPEMCRLLQFCEVETMPDDDGSGNAWLWKQIYEVLRRIDK